MNKTVSLRLPDKLKRSVDRLSRGQGKTPHAFMVEAIATEAERAAKWRDFMRESDEAEAEFRRTGLAYAMEDVHAYVDARLAGKRPRRPKPKQWR